MEREEVLGGGNASGHVVRMYAEGHGGHRPATTRFIERHQRVWADALSPSAIS